MTTWPPLAVLTEPAGMSTAGFAGALGTAGKKSVEEKISNILVFDEVTKSEIKVRKSYLVKLWLKKTNISGSQHKLSNTKWEPI